MCSRISIQVDMATNTLYRFMLRSPPLRHLYQRMSFRQLILKILFCFLVFLAIIFFMQSDFYIVRYNQPVVNIQGVERSKCCVLDTMDSCGRRNCIQCRNMTREDLSILTSGNNAFFHETSGSSELDTRQACAVESLALLNREINIFLLMTSQDGKINLTAPTMKALSDYSNIRIININLGQYFLGTPLEYWYFCTTWNYGEYAVSHLSDALRYLTLYKYGGYYFDLDILQLQPVSEFYRNFVVADVGLEFMAAGAFHVEYKHPIIRLALEEFRNTYRKRVWGYNGPELFTRIMKRWCGVDKISSMTSGKCHGFRVLPPKSFYPFSWLDWRQYFAHSETLPEWDEKVIGLHVWNKESALHPIYKFSNQVYAQVARTQCPLTFETAPEVF